MTQSILAGPIIKRLDANRISIWAATLTKQNLAMEIYFESAMVPWRDQFCESYRVTDGCYVNLIVVNIAELQEGAIYEYDLVSLGESEDPSSVIDESLLKVICLSGHSRPSFVKPLGKSMRWKRLAFGSCRLLHYALEQDAINSTSADSLREQGCNAVLLIGDFVYADNVSRSILEKIYDTGFIQLFANEESNVSGQVSNSELRSSVGSRIELLEKYSRKEILISADKKDSTCHLVCAAELTCMYLLAMGLFAPQYILGRLSGSEGAADIFTRLLDDNSRYARIFANISTYFLGDDHEVTDDWRIDSRWVGTNLPVRLEGERCLWYEYLNSAEALHLYFECLGNSEWSNDQRGALERIEQALIIADFNRINSELDDFTENIGYSFVLPLFPAVLVLDGRWGRRSRDADDSGNSISRFGNWGKASRKLRQGRMLPPAQLDSLRSLLRSVDPEVLTVVTQTAVIGLPFVENLQAEDYISGRSYKYDVEGWLSNPNDIYGLFSLLSEAGARRVVFVGGDLHFSYLASGEFSVNGGPSVRFAQVVSSGVKNGNDNALSFLECVLGASSVACVAACGANSDNISFLNSISRNSDGKELLTGLSNSVRSMDCFPGIRGFSFWASCSAIDNGSRRLRIGCNLLTLSVDGEAGWEGVNIKAKRRLSL